MKKRPIYTTSFKLEAGALILEKKYKFQQVCDALNVGEAAVRRWVKQYGNDQQGSAGASYEALTPKQREIQALKKLVQRLEMEKDILKKLLCSWLLMRSSDRVVSCQPWLGREPNAG